MLVVSSPTVRAVSGISTEWLHGFAARRLSEARRWPQMVFDRGEGLVDRGESRRVGVAGLVGEKVAADGV
eukprot:SAG31_NODE_683_length_12836_cov_8.304938_13_plen_70_part_00